MVCGQQLSADNDPVSLELDRHQSHETINYIYIYFMQQYVYVYSSVQNSVERTEFLTP